MVTVWTHPSRSIRRPDRRQTDWRAVIITVSAHVVLLLALLASPVGEPLRRGAEMILVHLDGEAIQLPTAALRGRLSMRRPKKSSTVMSLAFSSRSARLGMSSRLMPQRNWGSQQPERVARLKITIRPGRALRTRPRWPEGRSGSFMAHHLP
jgi:hypothetical protein